jgi:hypothetical protein
MGNRLEKVCCGVVLKIHFNSCNLFLTHGQIGISWLFACGGANRLDSKCGSGDTELSRRDFRNHEPDPSRSCAPKEVKKGLQLLNRSPEPYLPRILQGFLLPRRQRDLLRCLWNSMDNLPSIRLYPQRWRCSQRTAGRQNCHRKMQHSSEGLHQP